MKTKMSIRDLALVQNTIVFATHEFFAREHMITVPFPPTVGMVSCPKGAYGTDSQTVEIKFVKSKEKGQPTSEVYLCDSFQFYLEYLCRLNRTGVYSINPSHRCDQRDNTHLNVFNHIEAEIIGTIQDEMLLAEKLLRSLVSKVVEQHGDLISRQAGSTKHLESFLDYGPLPRVSIDDAEKIVGKNGIKINKRPFFREVTREGELRLIKEFGGWVWLTPIDHNGVSFFQAFHDDKTKAKSADLLMGLGEMIGSGQRHSNAEDLIEAIHIHGLQPDFYNWYIKLRSADLITTSGFGMGMERFLAWVFNSKDIRDFELFPRDYNKSLAFVP